MPGNRCRKLIRSLSHLLGIALERMFCNVRLIWLAPEMIVPDVKDCYCTRGLDDDEFLMELDAEGGGGGKRS